ncbi:hypothetical protein [Enterovibrio norvegicus]|uniref:hypothetical protein n=1 Tax=Enterovibrio norvegicus TaxID=188144 RepID=UPI00352EB469
MTSPVNKKRVIVIGGSGETGRRIIRFLTAMHPHLDLVGTSRQSGGQSLNKVPFVHFDLDDPDSAVDTLSSFDLAIIALGPMETIQAKTHLLCLKAGVDCIDINDSLSAADSIFSLNEAAKSSHLLMLTGMGFMPGLSTLMLSKIAEENRSEDKNYAIRAYMGAAYGGGKASPYAILASFSRYVLWFIDGKRKKIKTPWCDGKEAFTFLGHTTKNLLIPYSSVESAGLEAKRGDLYQHIEGLDARYSIQYLKQSVAKFFAFISPNERRNNQLAEKFYKSGQQMKDKKDADPDTILWCYPDNEPEKGLLLHGMISSYDLTALVAACCAELYLSDQMTDMSGVFGIENISEHHRTLLLKLLNTQGVTFKEANTDALKMSGLYFGWVECPEKSVEDMKHYYQNWYTAPKQHPRMIPLQKEFLLQSEIWKALKSRLSPLSFAGFIGKTLFRWRAHQKQLSDFSSETPLPQKEIWDKAVKDISMFTSGYSCARDVLGQETAFLLYRKMFLETGKMEMRWLWPDTQLFSLLEDPCQGATDYWIAYLKSYQHLNILSVSLDISTSRKISFTIKDCLYAKLFTNLGCPELSHLIREMEREALEYILLPNGGSVTWELFDQGDVQALITLASPSTVHKEADRKIEKLVG